MYRHCIYCSADLGSNESIEAFPVGKSLAFDAAKGRLWAVCPKCARWNLSPIEERWEAVEAAEKRFADTRLRVQNENVGLAKLPDGTRLIRVGAAVEGEMAAWRYGGALRRRRRRFVAAGVAGLALAGAVVGGGALFGVGAVTLLLQGGEVLWGTWRRVQPNVVAHRFRPGDLPHGDAFDIVASTFRGARLEPSEARAGFEVHVPLDRVRLGDGPDGKPWYIHYSGYALCGDDAPRGLGRGLAYLNATGASRRGADDATALLAGAGGADSFLRRAAGARLPVRGPQDAARRARRAHALALEMALHEETERRAMDGELALLESAWRQAEEIAAIADRLATAAGPSADDGAKPGAPELSKA